MLISLANIPDPGVREDVELYNQDTATSALEQKVIGVDVSDEPTCILFYTYKPSNFTDVMQHCPRRLGSGYGTRFQVR